MLIFASIRRSSPDHPTCTSSVCFTELHRCPRTGMVQHWRKLKASEPRWRATRSINRQHGVRSATTGHRAADRPLHEVPRRRRTSSVIARPIVWCRPDADQQPLHGGRQASCAICRVVRSRHSAHPGGRHPERRRDPRCSGTRSACRTEDFHASISSRKGDPKGLEAPMGRRIGLLPNGSRPRARPSNGEASVSVRVRTGTATADAFLGASSRPGAVGRRPILRTRMRPRVPSGRPSDEMDGVEVLVRMRSRVPERAGLLDASGLRQQQDCGCAECRLRTTRTGSRSCLRRPPCSWLLIRVKDDTNDRGSAITTMYAPARNFVCGRSSSTMNVVRRTGPLIDRVAGAIGLGASASASARNHSVWGTA